MSLAEREDMTIDRMILKLKSDAVLDSYNFQGYSREQKNQIAEWLKELKHYQLGDCMNDCEHYDNCSNYIYSKGYNKAIDDFAEQLRLKCIEDKYNDVHLVQVLEIAKQLKC